LVEQLYDIEDKVRLHGPEAYCAARQEQSVPILDRLEKLLLEQKGSTLSKSQHGRMIGYALNHWTELRRFTENGVLEIDNNIAERTVRLCIIGNRPVQPSYARMVALSRTAQVRYREINHARD
jgi:transposase